MVTGPLVVALILVKCQQTLVVHPGSNVNPSLAWRKANVFKINGDDDDLHLSFTNCLIWLKQE